MKQTTCLEVPIAVGSMVVYKERVWELKFLNFSDGGVNLYHMLRDGEDKAKALASEVNLATEEEVEKWKQSKVVPSTKPQRKVVFVIRGDERIPLSEVKTAQVDFVVSTAREWTTVDAFVNKITQQFSEYRMEDGAPLNQGGFDPMFCVTSKNPGALIKSGLLIFRPAPKGSGAQWEFKSRTAATQEEISEARNYAFKRNKFLYD